MPKCKDCIHFLVCANLYGEVQADTEIKNIVGEQCYYFKHKSMLSEWISCDEKMPAEFENVLAANKRGKHYNIDKCWWNGNFFDRCCKGAYHNVTHWMPLPEQPAIVRRR